MRRADSHPVLLIVAVFAALMSSLAQARELAPGFVQFSVQDATDNFITLGEVEFCLNGGGCLYADIDEAFPGHFYLDTAKLVPDRPYTVMIYNMDVQVIYEVRDWVFHPEDYDQGWDKVLDCEKFLVYPQFHGTRDKRLDFRVDLTLNPVWEERAGAGLVIGEADPHKFPATLFTTQLNSMLGGRFNTDANAAGGVINVSPGWQFSGTWRHHYPHRFAWDQGWLTVRELTVSYTQNRYETKSVMAPGRVSDVTFHRVNIAYGLARMNQSQVNHYGLAAVLSLGGIYDGRQKLSYRGRQYSLWGVGLQARYLKMFASGGGLDVGAVLEGSAVYYPVDARADDFWFGWAAAVSLGVVVF